MHLHVQCSSRRLWTAVNLTVAVLLAGVPALAQRGSITGRITETSGAVIVGARVIATDVATGINSTTVTNAEGYYSIPYLPPGGYSVQVEMTGFQKAVQSGVTLETEQVARIDMILGVGAVSQQIDVSARAPVVDSETASTSLMVDSKTIANLPTPGGGIYGLLLLAGEPTTGAVTAMVDPTTPRLGETLSVAGTPSSNTEFAVNGVPVMTRTMSAKMVPMEAVQEFRMDVVTTDASLGHSAGAFVNTTLKSGTNQLHGALWEFYTDKAMHAMNFFAKQFLNNPATGPVTPTKLALAAPTNNINRSGFSIGGPVYIPGVYNGKNRTFWMYTFEDETWNQATGSQYTVPTASERSGDFSALLAVSSQYQIYDPATIAPAAGGRFSRQPFPGNIIPASRISPIAKNILPYWPQPNNSGTVDGTNNYFSPAPFHTQGNNQVIRIDQVFNERNKFSFSGNINNQPYTSGYYFPNSSVEAITNDQVRYFVAEYVRILSPTLVLNVRGGMTYFARRVRPVSEGLDLTTLGFPQSLAQELGPNSDYFPTVSVSDYGALGRSGPSGYFDTTPTLATNVMKSKGAHTLRFGADLRVLRESSFALGYASPQFVFGTTYTNGPLDNSAAGPLGQGLASFLLGVPTSGQVNNNPSYAEQSAYYGFYVQDDLKLTPRLTLNLGLRYELEGGITERYNRSVRTFDAGVANPIAAQAQANYAFAPIPEIAPVAFKAPGGLTFAGVNGQPRSLSDLPRGDFAPRIGLAFSLNSKTVIRSGYSIMYDALGINHQSVIQTGFSQATNLIPSLNNGQTFVASLANPFPNGIQTAQGAALGLNTYLGQAISFYESNPKTPYMQRWSFGVQRELRRGMALDAEYVGNRGTHLLVSNQLDSTPAQYMSTLPVRDTTVINSLSANVANPFASIPQFAGTTMSSPTIARSQLLKPFPEFTGITASLTDGYSWYHSLRIRTENRFANDYRLQLSYTFSKFMQATSYLNPTDPSPYREISTLDHPNRFTAAGIWELPFGQGKKFLANAHGLAGQIVGGWQLNVMGQYQSGAPLAWGNIFFDGNIQDIVLRSDQRSVNEWFNTNAGFVKASSQQPADNIRTFPTGFSGIRAPSGSAWNLSIVKNFRAKEWLKVQLRGEFYNLFNRPDLSAPNTTPNSTAFGQITSTLADSNARWAMVAAKVMF